MSKLYCYFNENGDLLESIADGAVRKGSSGINSIYIYWENKPSFDLLTTTYFEVDHISNEEDSEYSIINATIPPIKNQDLKYFVYGKEYEFIVIELPQFTVNGSYGLTLRAYLSSTQVAVLGTILFSVENSIAKLSPEITQSQYDYLLYKLGEGNGDANVLNTEIKHIFLEYDEGYDVQRLKPSSLFTNYSYFNEDNEFVYDATEIASHSYVRFITTEIDSKFEQAIANNKAVVRLDYPIRKSQNYKKEIGYRGYGDRLQLRGYANADAVAYINNNLIFINEDDVKTDNNGNKYIDKKISVLSLLQKMTDAYSQDDEGIVKRFIELNNEDIPGALVEETRAFGGQWNNFPDYPSWGCKSNIGKPYTNGLKYEVSHSDDPLVGHTNYYKISTVGYNGAVTLAGENKIKTNSTKYINMIPVKCDDIELVNDSSELEQMEKPHFSDYYRRLDSNDTPSSTWFYSNKNTISLGDDSLVDIYGISANARKSSHSKWFTSLVTRPRLALLKDSWSDNPEDSNVSIWKKLYPQSLQQIFFYMPTVLSMDAAIVGLMKVQITHKP